MLIQFYSWLRKTEKDAAYFDESFPEEWFIELSPSSTFLSNGKLSMRSLSEAAVKYQLLTEHQNSTIIEMSSPTPKNVVDSYNFYAPVYDRLFGAVLEPGRKALAAEVHAIRPNSILEIGVGTGLLLSQYPTGTRVVGIDLSPEMLAIAEKRARDIAGIEIELRCANAEDLDFPDGAFDCVTLPYVLSVTRHPAELIKQAQRLCRPGGKILILNHFSGSRFWWFLERLVSPLANFIGFRSTFRYEEHVGWVQDLVEKSVEVNLFGLSKFIVLRNDR